MIKKTLPNIGLGLLDEKTNRSLKKNDLTRGISKSSI